MPATKSVERMTIEQTKAKAREDYRDYVNRTVNDDMPTDIDIAWVLGVTGKTFEDVEIDVERVRQRVQAVEMLEKADGLRPEIEKANRAASEAHDKLDEIRKRHKAELEEANRVASDLYSESSHLSRLAQDLRREASVIFRDSISRSTRERMTKLEREIGTTERRVADIDQHIQDILSLMHRKSNPQNQQDRSLHIDGEGRLPGLRRQVNGERQRLANLQAELDELRQSNFDPYAW